MDAEEQPMPGIDVVMVERLTRVETKLDSALESKRNDHAEFAKDIADHESRIRSLEKVWLKTAGLAAGVAAVMTTVGTIVARVAFGGV